MNTSNKYRELKLQIVISKNTENVLILSCLVKHMNKMLKFFKYSSMNRLKLNFTHFLENKLNGKHI